MNFKSVKIISKIENSDGINYNLMIDGQVWYYNFSQTKRITFVDKIINGVIETQKRSYLSFDIPMNESNPKETLERFFKLLLLN